MQRYETVNVGFQNRDPSAMPRTATVEFAPIDPITRGRRERPQVPASERSGVEPSYVDERSESLSLWLI